MFNSSNWMKFFINYDISKDLKFVTCPVLAVNGSLDLQVPAKQNLSEIKKVLEKSGNRSITIKEFDGLNHLFQITYLLPSVLSSYK